MGYAVMPYAVSLDRVRAALGSRDEGTVRAITNAAVTAAEIPAVAAALARVAVGGEVQESVDELRGWLRTCGETGRDLVGFYG